jgi:hypothetical protein
MKITIIPSDGAVYKDNASYTRLNLTDIPSNIHALQWKDTAGWIEFTDNPDGTKPQNELITSLPSWAITACTKWDETKIAKEIEIAERSTAQPQTIGTQLA